MDSIDAPVPSPEEVADLLTEARARTLMLVGPLSEEDLHAQHNALMSPVVWDLGHIAHFEELWLLRNLEGPMEFGEMPGMFNPFENPRATRGALALPELPETLATMAESRRRVLDGLERLREPHGLAESPLMRGGYVFRMVAQHEYQHNETMLQAMQLKGGRPYRAPRGVAVPEGRPLPAAEVRFPGGEVWIGTDDRTAAYDNERPRHRVELRPFWIDAAPVTNGAYLEFMNDGGYASRELWSDAGWSWLQDAGVEAPQFWERDGEGWRVRRMDRVDPLRPDHPVCHVCWYEADAFARWAGRRLPTEWEWEAACSWEPATGMQRRFPWGDEAPTARDANLDHLAFDTAPVGAYPRNASPIGAYGMIGDAWEWTSSDFAPYPGYRTFPYKEYSELFFGPDYKVLRGGSWATRPGAIRATFRNWDYPIRRQIFSGFRCARDA
ncbi:MAG: ergothioneine biosynthesis protein EgtB [Gemmatimonadota bacterium]|nr:ergothioneine biosynthesis protein EgtB [Gemmatimonadota bacterium]